jgi:hypothetical protein
MLCSGTTMHKIADVLWKSMEGGFGSWKSVLPDLMVTFRDLLSLMLLAIEYKKPQGDREAHDLDR